MSASLKSQTIIVVIVLVSLSALVFAIFQVGEVLRMYLPPMHLPSTFKKFSSFYDEVLDYGDVEQDYPLFEIEITPYTLQTAPNLLNELRKKRLLQPPPFDEPYKIVRHNNKTDDKVNQLQRKILKILRGKTHGFFVDVGVKDGISISNTLALEMGLGWTGILIEPNPVYFQILMKQRRKVWIINTCLGKGEIPENSGNLSKNSSINPILELSDEPNNTKTTTTECFSLVSIIAAVGEHLLTNVDYLSLNIEMARVDMLQNILWDHVYFKIISLEAIPGTVKPLLKFMEVKKYTFVCQFDSSSPSSHVYLFVHKKHRYNLELANNGFRRRDKNVTKKMRVKEKRKYRSQNKQD